MQMHMGVHRVLLMGGPKTWRLDKETEARGERAWPRAPGARVMVQTRSSPARVPTLCSHCEREVGNVAPVLPLTPLSPAVKSLGA